jgi:hypothetical protein
VVFRVAVGFDIDTAKRALPSKIVPSFSDHVDNAKLADCGLKVWFVGTAFAATILDIAGIGKPLK